MDNGLVDEEKNFILPLMVVGIVTVLALLVFGLFLPTVTWSW